LSCDGDMPGRRSDACTRGKTANIQFNRSPGTLQTAARNGIGLVRFNSAAARRSRSAACLSSLIGA
jgi:hypothetical protein